MVRWAWRLFRREWRQQALVLALLVVAVAATIVGLGVASNASQLKADPTFGTANTIITIAGPDPNLSADLATIQRQFGTVDVIAHQSLAVPGSVANIDLRAQDPKGPYGQVTLRLDSGRYPSGPGEVAVTHDVARTFGLHVGSAWNEGGRTRRVVGVVENPLNLLDQFALVAPGQANPPAQVSVLLSASQGRVQAFQLEETSLSTNSRGTSSRTSAEAMVLALGSLGLLFVGLMGVAGFTVMAQRRLRALGVLGSLGATDRHIRLVMVANGAAVGASAAVIGTAVGLTAWFAFVPTLQSISAHRVDRFALPWWAVAVAILLTVLTAIAAAWWPAQAAARTSVVGALSGRPPRPQPPHRFAALGGVLLATGIVLLAFADQRRVPFIITGTVTTAVGVLFLSPLAIRALASAAGRTTIAVRLAWRDLVRYQARSGAALGAVTLAIGIAATIAISASAAEAPSGPGNLPAGQLMLYLTPGGSMSQIPALSASQRQALSGTVQQLAGTLHASVVPLEQAYDPRSSIQPAQPGGPGGGQPAGYVTASLSRVTQLSHGQEMFDSAHSLYVANPALLAHYGLKPSQLRPGADIITSSNHLGGLQVFMPAPDASPGPPSGPPASDIAHPDIQVVGQLPAYTSDPNTLITTHAMQALGLQPLPAGWLLQARHPFTAAQLATARRAAASTGLYVESRKPQKSLAPLRHWSTAAGILLALGVLAMTVGLIRSETANDLRTLTAAGASTTTRRTLTGATSGALALLGALVGTAGAYAALLAWHRSHLSPLGHVPLADLLIILIGLPVIATAAGWLLSGREPPAINRRPIE
jgi:putative ABC transport system permease protein